VDSQFSKLKSVDVLAVKAPILLSSSALHAGLLATMRALSPHTMAPSFSILQAACEEVGSRVPGDTMLGCVVRKHSLSLCNTVHTWLWTRVKLTAKKPTL